MIVDRLHFDIRLRKEEVFANSVFHLIRQVVSPCHLLLKEKEERKFTASKWKNYGAPDSRAIDNRPYGGNRLLSRRIGDIHGSRRGGLVVLTEALFIYHHRADAVMVGIFKPLPKIEVKP